MSIFFLYLRLCQELYGFAQGWEIGSVAFLSFVDRDTHPTCTRCRGNVAPVTGFVTFVRFGQRLSGNFCVEVCLHCVSRLLALQALFLLRRLPPLAETSSGVSLPGSSSSSSSSLPLGGQGRQEGSQGAPGVLSGGASSPPARSRSSGRGGGASGLLSGARGRAPSSPSPSGAGEVGAARSL